MDSSLDPKILLHLFVTTPTKEVGEKKFMFYGRLDIFIAIYKMKIWLDFCLHFFQVLFVLLCIRLDVYEKIKMIVNNDKLRYFNGQE